MLYNQRTTPKAGERTWLWLLKIITGVLVIALLFLHLTVQHLIPENALLDFDGIVAWLSNPIIAGLEIIFLITVVSHALLGTRSILLDLNPSAGVLRVIDGTFLVIGAVSIVYGIWLIMVIISFGAG